MPLIHLVLNVLCLFSIMELRILCDYLFLNIERHRGKNDQVRSLRIQFIVCFYIHYLWRHPSNHSYFMDEIGLTHSFPLSVFFYWCSEHIFVHLMPQRYYKYLRIHKHDVYFFSHLCDTMKNN